MTALSEPNSSNPTGRRQGFFHGYYATDAVIFNRALSATEKLVLAATAAHPTRDPSLAYLTRFVPGNKSAIRTAQNRLEQVFGAITYDRPGPEDRDPESRRFRHTNRAMILARWADPLAPGNERRRVWLPGQLANTLAGGRKNAALVAVVALFYSREQLRRGAIHVEDAAAAALLKIGVRQLERAREALIDAGALVKAKKAPYSFIYTMPGATAREAKPEGIDVKRTRRLHQAPVDVGAPVMVYADEAEWRMLSARFSGIHPAYRGLVVVRAYEKLPPVAVIEEFTIRQMLGNAAPLTTQATLEALAEILHETSVRTTDKGRSGTPVGGVHDPGSSETSNHEIKTLAACGRKSRSEESECIDPDRRYSSSEQAVTAIIKHAHPALSRVFGPDLAQPGRKAEQIVNSAVRSFAQRAHLRGGLQIKIVLDELNHQLNLIPETRPLGERYAMLRTAARHITHDDDLYDQVKNARPTPKVDVIAMLEAEG